MKYIKLFEEVRYINREPIKYKYSGKSIFDEPTIVRKEEPLMDNDKIRVYHGFNSWTDVKEILKHGLSGKERARRIYSYESGNNPSGLFVSIDLNKIKKDFSYSGVIIEFTTKVSDLEAPVWVGGRSYFVQGEYTKSFKDLDEREQQRLINRELHGKNEFDFISKSDRPELAQTIFENPERQALYIGDLNPNMIKYIWYKEPYDPKKRGEERNWERYTRNDFINYINKEFKKDKNKREVNTKLNDYQLYYPNDEFTIEDFIKRVESRENEKDKERFSNGRFQAYLKHYLDDEHCNEYELRQFGFFPRQIKEIMKLRKEGAFKKYINEAELRRYNDN